MSLHLIFSNNIFNTTGSKHDVPTRKLKVFQSRNLIYLHSIFIQIGYRNIYRSVVKKIASATVTFDSPASQVKECSWYPRLFCLTFNNKKESVKPTQCAVDRWESGSLTSRPKSPFTGFLSSATR